jgi:hypothetical protein
MIPFQIDTSIQVVLDGFSVNYPIILTPKEYEKLVLKESMRIISKKAGCN